jgi:hypothetical protein
MILSGSSSSAHWCDLACGPLGCKYRKPDVHVIPHIEPSPGFFGLGIAELLREEKQKDLDSILGALSEPSPEVRPARPTVVEVGQRWGGAAPMDYKYTVTGYEERTGLYEITFDGVDMDGGLKDHYRSYNILSDIYLGMAPAPTTPPPKPNLGCRHTAHLVIRPGVYETCKDSAGCLAVQNYARVDAPTTPEAPREPPAPKCPEYKPELCSLCLKGPRIHRVLSDNVCTPCYMAIEMDQYKKTLRFDELERDTRKTLPMPEATCLAAGLGIWGRRPTSEKPRYVYPEADLDADIPDV